MQSKISKAKRRWKTMVAITVVFLVVTLAMTLMITFDSNT